MSDSDNFTRNWFLGLGAIWLYHKHHPSDPSPIPSIPFDHPNLNPIAKFLNTIRLIAFWGSWSFLMVYQLLEYGKISQNPSFEDLFACGLLMVFTTAGLAIANFILMFPISIIMITWPRKN